MYYFNIFFIYSIIGYFYEILICLLFNNKLESGFMYGPWTPIYGIGVLLILIVSKTLFKKLKLNKIVENIIFFFIIIFILTTIEWIAGNLLYLIYHKDFWNYSNMIFSIGKYISLLVSLIWGLFSFIVLYIIHPQIKKITKKIPKFFTYTLIILFIIDLLFSFIK